MKLNDAVAQSIRKNALKAVNSGYVMDLSLEGTMIKPTRMTMETYRKLKKSMKEPGIDVPTHVDQQQSTGSGMSKDSAAITEKPEVRKSNFQKFEAPSVEQKKPENVEKSPMKPQDDERERKYTSVQKTSSEAKMGQMSMNSVAEKIAEMRAKSQMENSKGKRKNRSRSNGMDR